MQNSILELRHNCKVAMASKLYWVPWLSWHAHDIAFEIAFEEHSLWSLLELLIYVIDLKQDFVRGSHICCQIQLV